MGPDSLNFGSEMEDIFGNLRYLIEFWNKINAFEKSLKSVLISHIQSNSSNNTLFYRALQVDVF